MNNNELLQKEKLGILKKLFILFDTFSEEIDKVCREGCSDCCTRNVTLTSLEAQYILSGLNVDEKNVILTKILNERHKAYLIPKTTINQMAKICMAGEEPPEEYSDPSWGNCPLLEDKRCMIYGLRPFACRTMISKKRCSLSGYADMDDYTVTLSNVFMQYIEHIDTGRYFGNLSDILLFDSNKDKYSFLISSENLIVNRSIEMVMVPPEHRRKILKVIKYIKNIL